MTKKGGERGGAVNKRCAWILEIVGSKCALIPGRVACRCKSWGK